MPVEQRVPFSQLTPANPASPFRLSDIIAKSDLTIPQSQKATLAQLIAFILANVKQIYSYTSDPNVEGVTPANISIENMCYPKGGIGPLYVWDMTNHLWI